MALLLCGDSCEGLPFIAQSGCDGLRWMCVLNHVMSLGTFHRIMPTRPKQQQPTHSAPATLTDVSEPHLRFQRSYRPTSFQVARGPHTFSQTHCFCMMRTSRRTGSGPRRAAKCSGTVMPPLSVCMTVIIRSRIGVS